MAALRKKCLIQHKLHTVLNIKSIHCKQVKVKMLQTYLGKGGAHLPFYGHWAGRWIDHWVHDAWPVRRQTYGYLPRIGVSPPFDRYKIILLAKQRHMCVNDLPKVVTWQCTKWKSNLQPRGYQFDTLPLHHQARASLYTGQLHFLTFAESFRWAKAKAER